MSSFFNLRFSISNSVLCCCNSSLCCFSFQLHSTHSSIDSKCTFIFSPPCRILSSPCLVSYRFSALFQGLVCVDRSLSDCSIVPCSPKILPCRFGYILLTSASPLSVPSLRYLLFLSVYNYTLIQTNSQW